MALALACISLAGCVAAEQTKQNHFKVGNGQYNIVTCYISEPVLMGAGKTAFAIELVNGSLSPSVSGQGDILSFTVVTDGSSPAGTFSFSGNGNGFSGYYSLGVGGSAPTQLGLTAGTLTVKISDNNNCEIDLESGADDNNNRVTAYFKGFFTTFEPET